MGKPGMLVIFGWWFLRDFFWVVLMVSWNIFSGLLSDVDRLLMVFECFWWDVYGIQKLGFTGFLTNQNQGFLSVFILGFQLNIMCNSENGFVKGKSWSAFVGVAIAERVLNWFIGVYRGFMCFSTSCFGFMWLNIWLVISCYFQISVISYRCLWDRGKHHKNMCKTYGQMSVNDCVCT